MKAGFMYQLSILADRVDFSHAPAPLRAGDTPTFPRHPSNLTVHPSLFPSLITLPVGGVPEGVGRGVRGPFWALHP